MARQWGLVTRRQALEAGLAPAEIDNHLRRGRWESVRRGVYAPRAHLDNLTDRRQHQLLLDRAGSLRVGEPHVMSHHSAALLLGIDTLAEPTPITHIGRPGIVGAHVRHGVKHHLAPFGANEVTRVRGIDVLDPARTALDIAREHGYQQGLVAADSALRRGSSVAALHAAARRMRSWPGVTTVRAVIAAASPHSDSVAETLGRDLVLSLGYGAPQTQFGLTAEGRTAWCDLRLGRHVFEIDGRQKYRPEDSGQRQGRTGEEMLWDEKLRQDFVSGFKLGISRLTWRDFFAPHRAAALERCRREYLDTCHRFGTDVADLARFRPRGPRRRPTPAPPAALPWWTP